MKTLREVIETHGLLWLFLVTIKAGDKMDKHRLTQAGVYGQ